MLRYRVSFALTAVAACTVAFIACSSDEEFTAPPGTTSTTGGGGVGGDPTTTTGGQGGTGGVPCDDSDADMDGVSICDGDCDDMDPTTAPGFPELCGDTIDNDCDGNGDPTSCNGLGTYVSELTGDDTTGDGTQMNPVATIGQGMTNSALLNNQTVFVAEGDYAEKVTMVEGISLWGGHQCDTNSCSWARDATTYISIIAAQDAVGVLAGDTLTRATAIDGFTIQGQTLNNPASNTDPIAFTINIGSPTVSNNHIEGGDITGGCSNCDSIGIRVQGAQTVAVGPLIDSNLIESGDTTAATFAVDFRDFSNKGVAEISNNDIRGGDGRYTRGINGFAIGAGTVIRGNTVHAGSLVAGGNFRSSFAMIISGNLLVEGNWVNTDPNLVGDCGTLQTFWCGGIESEGATVTLNNNIVMGMPGVRSAGIFMSDGEVPFGMIIMNGNTVGGGGDANHNNGNSAALACRTNQGTNARIGNIRNNILLGGASVNRWAFYEDDQQSALTCEPSVYENNLFHFPTQANTNDNAHRRWSGGGNASTLTDATAVNAALSYAQNNTQQDPLLDATWHLMSGSPAIDAGTTPEAPATDIDGETRPQGNGIDVGADEAI
jgi:hypothetical protein